MGPGGSMTALGAIESMFRGFADRTRLRILHLLRRQGEMCVGDLVATLRVPQPRASRHLAYLRRAGLVDVRRDGQWKHYSLSPSRTAAQRALVASLDRFAGIRELRSDSKRLRAIRAGGGCCPR
jgi:ArsR family transcriptional regulator